MGQTFAQIVAVLMRDPNYRKMKLADLEWLVLPPVMAGQFKLAHAPVRNANKLAASGKAEASGILVPVAVALWARVSPELDKALSDTQIRLKANEWASGEHIWMMAVGGDPRALPSFLKQLSENDFKSQQVKMRVSDRSGKSIVKTL